MGKLRKIGRKIKKGMSSVGKKLKKGLGSIAKAFGKLGPLGSIALSFILPGMGSALSGWLGNMGSFGQAILKVGQGIQKGANWVKDGVGRVFNRVTDAIEMGMNKVSSILPGGKGTAGSSFRDWVSETTGGFIDKSTVGVEDKLIPSSSRTFTLKDGTTRTVTSPSEIISPDMQVGNITGPKIPKAPKGMTDPVYMDGTGGGMKKGFYESADLEKYYTGVDTPVGNYNIKAPTGEPMKGFKNASAPDMTGGTKPIVGKNAITGKDIPITTSSTIKTSTGLDMPEPYKDPYLTRVKGTFKKLAPLTAAGAYVVAQEDAETTALMNASLARNFRHNQLANQSLKAVEPTYETQGQSFVNINNLDNDAKGMQQMTSGYGLILGDFYT